MISWFGRDVRDQARSLRIADAELLTSGIAGKFTGHIAGPGRRGPRHAAYEHRAGALGDWRPALLDVNEGRRGEQVRADVLVVQHFVREQRHLRAQQAAHGQLEGKWRERIIVRSDMAA
jgi:hypothetical protein